MSELTEQQTKEYLKTALSLEVALYQNDQLIQQYTKQRKDNAPVKPAEGALLPPPEPTLRSLSDARTEGMTPGRWGVLALFYGCFCLGAMLFYSAWLMRDTGSAGTLVFFGLVLLALSAGCFYHLWSVSKRELEAAKEKINTENQKATWQYEQAMQCYRTAMLEADKEYNAQMQAYDLETNEQLRKFDEVHEILTKSLDEWYSLNVVYEKYRNLVAIATIYEYFDSRRCAALEGRDGAYNMYEGELCANVIIGSLTQIISDLDQIKCGQYALYKQLSCANAKVTTLLQNIQDAQELTVHYAEAAAIAAAADKKITGEIIIKHS